MGQNGQAFSTSNAVGGDHRIVSTFIKLSLRSNKSPTTTRLYWPAVALSGNVASIIDTQISNQFTALPPDEQTYTSFVKIANNTGSNHLPKRPKLVDASCNNIEVNLVRLAAIQASASNIQSAQNNLRRIFDSHETLSFFETPASSIAIRNAWSLVKELSGKKNSKTINIEGDDRLELWKNHFQKLLTADNDIEQDDHEYPIHKIFDTFNDLTQKDMKGRGCSLNFDLDTNMYKKEHQHALFLDLT